MRRNLKGRSKHFLCRIPGCTKSRIKTGFLVQSHPKAKERIGYPTQKPILLLERIIEISTDEEDLVLDPFCGSGTTLVAAELMKRDAIGIDISADAFGVSKERVSNPGKTESCLPRRGREAYQQADQDAIGYLKGLEIVPIQRNSGIDALLRTRRYVGPVPIRVQRPGESLLDAANALHRAARTKDVSVMILVATERGFGFDIRASLPPEVIVVDATAIQVLERLDALQMARDTATTRPPT